MSTSVSDTREWASPDLRMMYPELPDVPDPAGSLAAEDPDWRYASWAGSGYGIGHLRVYAPACGGTLALVTETGRGGSVSNSIHGIMWELRRMTRAMGRDPKRLAVLAVWPGAAAYPAGKRVHQMSHHALSRRVWPQPCPTHQDVIGWWERNAQRLALNEMLVGA